MHNPELGSRANPILAEKESFFHFIKSRTFGPATDVTQTRIPITYAITAAGRKENGYKMNLIPFNCQFLRFEKKADRKKEKATVARAYNHRMTQNRKGSTSQRTRCSLSSK